MIFRLARAYISNLLRFQNFFEICSFVFFYFARNIKICLHTEIRSTNTSNLLLASENLNPIYQKMAHNSEKVMCILCQKYLSRVLVLGLLHISGLPVLRGKRSPVNFSNFEWGRFSLTTGSLIKNLNGFALIATFTRFWPETDQIYHSVTVMFLLKQPQCVPSQYANW